VGVGTFSPEYALDVHGSANVGALTATTFSGSGAGLNSIPSSAISGTLSQWIDINTNDIHYSAGNVGIGKTPDSGKKLDVDGTVKATTFEGEGSALTALNAANITTGTLDAARVPDLDAAKITTGTLDAARVPTPTTFTTADFSGDVTVDTDTFHVDTTDDRVGIGTASPSQLFHVHKNLPNTAHHVMARIGGDTSSYNTLVFGSKDGRPHVGGHRGDFGTWADLSIQDDALIISQSGYVRIPSLPIASLSDSRNSYIFNADLTSANFYNKTWINNGNHFNASTGRFTCPVDGIYRIYFRVTATAATNVRLRKDGGGINEAYAGASNNNQRSVSSEAIVSCDANDYLHIQVSELTPQGGTQHCQVTFQQLG
jgi:hypothetical protein